MRREYRVNRRITASPLRVIDNDGAQLGIMTRRDALSAAQQRELYLVEVNPGAKPPICRIMDWKQWKAQQARRDRYDEPPTGAGVRRLPPTPLKPFSVIIGGRGHA